MTGLYIHIPFCKSRCIYCGFYSTVHADWQQRYTDALCKEIRLREINAKELTTIYLGGGTPSQLTIGQLQQLFQRLDDQQAKEITMECNPDDVTEELAEAIHQLPINRVSMGAQTFNPDRLQFLHRRHTAEQVKTAVQRLRQAGINNISIDLMYGFPQESMAEWDDDLAAALNLNVEHLSAYCLMVEEGTPLYQLVQKGKTKVCDEETERAMYEQLINRLEHAGYEHYEISNFARPGYRSMHNSSYWNSTPYVGLGAAAHSFDGENRSWNVSDLKEYTEEIESGKLPSELEILNKQEHYNDIVMLRLRTREGIDLNKLRQLFGETSYHYCIKNARKFLDDGLLTMEDSHLKLSRKGLFISDLIMSELMDV